MAPFPSPSPSRRPGRRRLPRALMVAAVGASLAAACEPPPMHADPTLEERYPISVEPRAVYLDLEPGRDGKPRWNDDRLIRSFVAEWVEAGHGPLMVAAGDSGTAERTRGAIARVAGELRGSPSQVRTARQRVSSGGIVLAFRRLTAVQPDCALETAALGDPVNTRSSVLGCATRRNLAAMVADPADLIAPAIPSGNAFAARRGLVIEKWRKGESTGAQTPEAEARSAGFVNNILGGGGGGG